MRSYSSSRCCIVCVSHSMVHLTLAAMYMTPRPTDVAERPRREVPNSMLSICASKLYTESPSQGFGVLCRSCRTYGRSSRHNGSRG
ncbi:hypothetical protein C8T65DRAFT_664513 [Cerioporus squamosus]|nr:hypothetical protein C8T65DRAFT_664513 [Cerioporus squamosus]